MSIKQATVDGWNLCQTSRIPATLSTVHLGSFVFVGWLVLEMTTTKNGHGKKKDGFPVFVMCWIFPMFCPHQHHTCHTIKCHMFHDYNLEPQSIVIFVEELPAPNRGKREGHLPNYHCKLLGPTKVNLLGYLYFFGDCSPSPKKGSLVYQWIETREVQVNHEGMVADCFTLAVVKSHIYNLLCRCTPLENQHDWLENHHS